MHDKGAVDHRVYVYASGAMVASFIRTETLNDPTPGVSSFTHTTQYLHGDNLGSISVISDESGNLVERLSYDRISDFICAARTVLPGTELTLDHGLRPGSHSSGQ